MKKTLSILFCAATLLIVMQACSGGKGKDGKEKNGNGSEEKAGKDLKGMKELHLGEYGFPLKIMVPKEDPSRQVPPASAKFNEATGKLEILAGKGFQLAIFEKIRPIKEVKQELKDDLMFKNTFLTEEKGKLIYKSELPDGSQTFYHFYLEKTVDGRDYVVRSLKTGEFNKPNVDRMLKAAESLAKAPIKQESAS